MVNLDGYYLPPLENPGVEPLSEAAQQGEFYTPPEQYPLSEAAQQGEVYDPFAGLHKLNPYATGEVLPENWHRDNNGIIRMPNGWAVRSDGMYIAPDGKEYKYDRLTTDDPRIAQTFIGAFSQRDIVQLKNYANTNPQGFVTAFAAYGMTNEGRAMLTQMGLTQDQINTMFSENNPSIKDNNDQTVNYWARMWQNEIQGKSITDLTPRQEALYNLAYGSNFSKDKGTMEAKIMRTNPDVKQTWDNLEALGYVVTLRTAARGNWVVLDAQRSKELMAEYERIGAQPTGLSMAGGIDSWTYLLKDKDGHFISTNPTKTDDRGEVLKDLDTKIIVQSKKDLTGSIAVNTITGEIVGLQSGGNIFSYQPRITDQYGLDSVQMQDGLWISKDHTRDGAAIKNAFEGSVQAYQIQYNANQYGMMMTDSELIKAKVKTQDQINQDRAKSNAIYRAASPEYRSYDWSDLVTDGYMTLSEFNKVAPTRKELGLPITLKTPDRPITPAEYKEYKLKEQAIGYMAKGTSEPTKYEESNWFTSFLSDIAITYGAFESGIDKRNKDKFFAEAGVIRDETGVWTDPNVSHFMQVASDLLDGLYDPTNKLNPLVQTFEWVKGIFSALKANSNGALGINGIRVKAQETPVPFQNMAAQLTQIQKGQKDGLTQDEIANLSPSERDMYFDDKQKYWIYKYQNWGYGNVFDILNHPDPAKRREALTMVQRQFVDGMRTYIAGVVDSGIYIPFMGNTTDLIGKDNQDKLVEWFAAGEKSLEERTLFRNIIHATPEAWEATQPKWWEEVVGTFSPVDVGLFFIPGMGILKTGAVVSLRGIAATEKLVAARVVLQMVNKEAAEAYELMGKAVGTSFPTGLISASVSSANLTAVQRFYIQNLVTKLQGAKDALVIAEADMKAAGGVKQFTLAVTDALEGAARATKNWTVAQNELKAYEVLGKTVDVAKETALKDALAKATIAMKEGENRAMVVLADQYTKTGIEEVFNSWRVGKASNAFVRLPKFDEFQKAVFAPSSQKLFVDMYEKGLLGSRAAKWLYSWMNLDSSMNLSWTTRAKLMYNIQLRLAKSIAWVETAGLMRTPSIIKTGRDIAGNKGIVKNLKYIGTATQTAKGNPIIHHVLNVIMHPEQYRFDSTVGKWAGKLASEHPEIQKIHQLLEVNRINLLKEYGIEPNMLALEEGEHWISHAVESVSGRSIGALKRDPAWMSKQKFDDISDGIAAGSVYRSDYKQLTQDILNQTYTFIAKKNYIDFAMKEGYKDPLILENMDKIKIAISELDTMKTWVKELADSIGNKQLLGDLLKKMQDAGAMPQLVNNLTKNLAKEAYWTDNRLLMSAARMMSNKEGSISRLQSTIDKMKGLQGISHVQGTEGLKFDKAIADDIVKSLSSRTVGRLEKALQWVSMPNQVMRTLLTAFDFGAGLIQGIVVLFAHPDIWAESQVSALKSAVNPNNLARFASDHAATLKQMITKGGMVIETPEFLEGVGIMNKVPVLRNFSAAFSGFMDTSRTLMWEARYKPTLYNARQAQQLGAFIDKFNGTSSSWRTGQTPMQALAETIVLFAPRYYRSCLGLIGDMFKGGLPARLAIQDMARFQAGVYGSYFTLATMTEPITGEGPHMSPTDPHYLQFKIGDTWVGIGSFWTSFSKMIGKNVLALNQGRYDKVLTFDPSDSILMKHIRGKFSTILSATVDSAFNSNYFGQPIWDEGISKGFGKLFTTKMLPIWAQALIQGDEKTSWSDRWLRGLGEFGGARTTPQLPWDTANDVADSIAQKQHGVSMDYLYKNHYEDWAKIRNMPQVKAAYDEAYKQDTTRGQAGWSATQHEFYQYIAQYNPLKDVLTGEINAIYKDWKSGKIPSIDERDKKVADAQTLFADSLKTLKEKFPLADKYIKDPRQMINDADPMTNMLIDYTDTVRHNPDLFKEGMDAKTYYQVLGRLRTEWQQRWGDTKTGDDSMLAKVENNYRLISDYDPTYILMQVNKETVSLTKDKTNGKTYYDTDEGNARLEFRARNPNVDAALLILGRTSTIQSLEAYNLAVHLVWDQGLPVGVPFPYETIETNKKIEQNKILQQNIDQTIPRGSRPTPEIQTIKDKAFDITGEIAALQYSMENVVVLQQQQDAIDKIHSLVADLRDEQQKWKDYTGDKNDLQYRSLGVRFDGWMMQYEKMVKRIESYRPIEYPPLIE